MNGVEVACPAKVNLFLRILAREDSGYHQIETLFQAIGLYDRVEARRIGRGASARAAARAHSATRGGARDGIALEIRRAESAAGTGDIVGDLGDPGENTVTRAARAFFATTGIAPAARLVLTKAIPAGTGLGGGSSDAAGALIALNLLHGEPLGGAELAELGGRIGADVPFFCARVATALAWGRGDRLLVRPPPPAAHAVLVIPRDRVSTAAAYREASARLTLPAGPATLSGPEAGDWSAIGSLQGNDFERPVFGRFPRLREVRDTLARHGAVVARLTGSGSAVFGVFGDERDALRAARTVGDRPEVAAALVAPTLATLPEPVSP